VWITAELERNHLGGNFENYIRCFFYVCHVERVGLKPPTDAFSMQKSISYSLKTITKETTADKTVFSFDFTTLSQAKQSENKRQEKKRRVKGLKSEGR
jgi:hypothetical protein